MKAHRTKKEMQQVSVFERFIAKGNEKSDEFAQEGAMIDGGLMAQVRASTVQQEREEGYAALQHAARIHYLVEERKDGEELKPTPKEKWTFVNKHVEARKHRTEWCAAAIKCRCLTCGRSSTNLKIQGKCEGPKLLQEDSKHNLGRWSKSHLGGHDMVRRVDRNGETQILGAESVRVMRGKDCDHN